MAYVPALDHKDCIALLRNAQIEVWACLLVEGGVFPVAMPVLRSRLQRALEHQSVLSFARMGEGGSLPRHHFIHLRISNGSNCILPS